MSLDVTGSYRYPPPNSAWLALCTEAVLEPDLPIVDAHHHLWTEGGAPYLLDELSDDLASGHQIEATVFVQAHYGYRPDGPVALRPVGETEKVASLRAEARRRGSRSDVAAAIVGFVDLTLGDDAAEVIEAHQAAAPDAFRGVRHSVSRDELFPNGIVLRPAPAGLLSSDSYRGGLKAVERAGLSYDAMLYHGQIDELVDCARAFPNLPIVLDHYGCLLGVGPYEGRRDELMVEWRRSLTRLAAFPNVTIKLGGLGMIVCGARWHLDDQPPSSSMLAGDWRPMFDTAVDIFGPDRCMLESNFPVDKAMWSYRTLWNTFKRLTISFSPSERDNLFRGTASRFYRLAPQ
nr:amidohydrolase family protein [uncultured Sphingomonas sp.]